MADAREHRIRLSGPWWMRVDGVPGSYVDVRTPFAVDASENCVSFERRFHWATELPRNASLYLEVQAETEMAAFHAETLRFFTTRGRRRAEIGRFVQKTNEILLYYNPEKPFVFEGATLVVSTDDDEPMWRPDFDRIRTSNLHQFHRRCFERGWMFVEPILTENDRGRRAVYDDIHAWSINQPEEFWNRIWFDTASGRRSHPRQIMLKDGDRMPGASWLPNATVNYVENVTFDSEAAAIVAWNEFGRRSEWSYTQLADHVTRLAVSLKAMGVVKGDRVAAYMPNLPENVAMFLATASIGAIWSSCSPDFGESGALDRLGQIGPKVLIIADGYWFKGKRIDTLDRAKSLAEKLSTVERVVLVPYANPIAKPDGIRKAVLYDDFIGPKTETFPKLEFEQLPFDHPLYILFSSGTTGVPKGIVHGHGGSLLQHVKELSLHTDVKPGDRLFYFTTCGWMMWNWLVSGLACGATIYLYDGSPFHANADILWEMAEKERITHFGASAKYFAAAEKSGVKPVANRDLSSLRTILSTGSPLAPESFDYIYRDVKEDVCLSSISGGTDIVSCFALGNPTLPVYRGELQCIGLGMAVEVWGEYGKPVESGPGELVCTKPFPSMPVAFWNDPDGSKYKAAYFEHFPGVWRHGDFVERTEHGGLIVYGRSDATLNPSGVRIGTAEIYRQVEKLPEILESLAVGQPWDGDERIILFVRLREGIDWTADLDKRLREEIRTGATPRHVPAKIVPAPDLPRTLNAKLAELAVKDVLAGRTVRNIGALANPESLEFFKNLPELRS